MSRPTQSSIRARSVRHGAFRNIEPETTDLPPAVTSQAPSSDFRRAFRSAARRVTCKVSLAQVQSVVEGDEVCAADDLVAKGTRRPAPHQQRPEEFSTDDVLRDRGLISYSGTAIGGARYGNSWEAGAVA